MKKEMFLDAMGKMDDEFIDEYNLYKKTDWKKWCLAAACLAMLVYAGVRLLPQLSSNTPKASDIIEASPTIKEGLPLLTLSTFNEAMGFEGFMAYDISELENGNPWMSNTKLDTLPVYKNLAYTNAAGLPVNSTVDAMLELAQKVATALNMNISDITYGKVGDFTNDMDIDKTAVYQVIAETDTAEITVTGNNTVTVMFNEAVALPDKYNFTYADTTDEEAAADMNYLLTEYASLVPFAVPHNALFSDYTIYGDRNRSYYAYDSNGSLEEQLLNYNFAKVTFGPDDNGKLMLIRISNLLSTAEKIGDYPLITQLEATELLLNGNYITSVPEKMPGQEYIAKVELMYRTSNIDDTYIPYYRFLVELPDMVQDNGLKNYGAYYVPAVQQQYIADMPTWEGNFN